MTEQLTPNPEHEWIAEAKAIGYVTGEPEDFSPFDKKIGPVFDLASKIDHASFGQFEVLLQLARIKKAPTICRVSALDRMVELIQEQGSVAGIEEKFMQLARLSQELTDPKKEPDKGVRFQAYLNLWCAVADKGIPTVVEMTRDDPSKKVRELGELQERAWAIGPLSSTVEVVRVTGLAGIKGLNVRWNKPRDKILSR